MATLPNMRLVAKRAILFSIIVVKAGVPLSGGVDQTPEFIERASNG